MNNTINSKNIGEFSYWVCSEMINNMSDLFISAVAVYNIVQLLGEEMSNIINANLHSKYDMSKVKLRVLNSNGGKWIKIFLQIT